MKAAVLVEDYFDERELIFPLYRLQELGFEVDLLAPKPGLYHGKNGFPLRVDSAVDPGRAGSTGWCGYPAATRPTGLGGAGRYSSL